MRFKKTLLATQCASILLAMSNPTFAQQQSQNGENATPDTDDVEVISVRGIRASVEQSTELKRDSVNVVDAITAEDVGKFPDQNVAESLQRITGVQITRLRGEGQNATIRGLPSNFVDVTLNGVSVPNALRTVFFNVSAPDRSFDFTILPTEFIRTLEVSKSSMADLPSGGLAGSIDVKTPRPFDFGKRVISFSAQAANESNTDDISPKYTAFFSDIFADDTIGVALGVTYTNRKLITESIRNIGFNSRTERQGFNNAVQIGAFTGDGSDASANASTCSGAAAGVCFGQDFNGDGVLGSDDELFRLPSVTIYDNLVEQRERASALFSFQYRPASGLEFYLDGLYSSLEIDNQQLEGLFLQPNSVGPFLPDQAVIQDFGDFNNVVTTFAAQNTDYRNNNRIERRDGDLYMVTAGMKYELDTWDIESSLTVSESTQDADALALVNVTYVDVVQEFTLGAELPTTTLLNGSEARVTTDANASRLANINGEFGQTAERDLFDFQFDASKTFDDDIFHKLTVGAQYSDRSLFVNNPRLFIPLSGVVNLLGPQAPSAFNESLGFTDTHSAEDFLLTFNPDNSDFLGGAFPAQRFYGDTRFLFDNFTSEELAAQGTIDPRANTVQDIEEQLYDAYVRLDFGSEYGRLTGNIGLRLSHNELTSRGVGTDLSTIQLLPDLTTSIVTLDNFEVDNSYTELLPSLNLRFEATDDLILRTALSRTMARPSLSAISPATNINALTATLSGGNPELDPFLSNNFDLGIEYYWGDSSYVSATYFMKDLVSLVRTGNSRVTLPVNFVDSGTTSDVTFIDTSPANGVGATIDGIEIGYQQLFTDAPGLLGNMGVSANYTLVNSSDEAALPGASRDNYNLGVFYEDDFISTRLTYTFRDSFQTEIEQFAEGVNTIEQEFATLDGSIQFNFSDYTFFIEGNNLLAEPVVQNYSFGGQRSHSDSGRRVAIGVRATY